MASDGDRDEHDAPEAAEKSEGKADDRSKPEQPDGKESDGEKDDAEGGDGDKEEDEGPPIYKRPLFWIILAVVATILIVGGILYWLHARKYVSTDDAFVDAHIVRIAAQVSGQLVVVPDNDNRQVHLGQLLAKILPGTPETQLLEAQAGVKQADAAILQAQARVLSARATARQQAANTIAPTAESVRAAHDYQRYAALLRLDRAAAAATQVEQARTQAVSTAGQAQTARRQADAAAADVVAARKEVTAARAQRTAAVARVASARVVTNYTTIVAPVNGQVVNRQVDTGSYVAPGQQLMAVVPDQMWITANFKETQLKRMRPGQHVDITIDAYPGVTFPGHVDSIQHGSGQAFALLPAQNATGNYVKVVQRVPVRILFDGSTWRHYAVGPGMSVVPRVTVR